MIITLQTLKQATKALSKCKYLKPVIKTYGQCVINPENRDPFDTLIRSIISQQLSTKAADTIEGRVRNLVGNKFRPTKLLTVERRALRACGLSSRKVEYIQGIAAAVKSRKLNFGKLAEASDEEVMQKLIELRGVGQWSAEMFMIFSLGRMDIFSISDVGLQRGMRILFGEQAVDLITMEKLAERWQPYRSVASWYLWKVASLSDK